MSCGKWSPTVSASYAADEGWWDKHKKDPNDLYDVDGYDEYGYHHATEKDRAGYTEDDYLLSGRWETYGDDEVFEYPLYEDVAREWAGKVIS